MKVEVKRRSDNERGLFATQDIKKNEFVCVLPIDYFQLDDKWYTIEKNEKLNPRAVIKLNLRYGIIFDIPTKDYKFNQLHNFNEFVKKNYTSFFTSCFLKQRTELIGVSNENRLDDKFIGHMINDYVNMSFLTEGKYEVLSRDYSNVVVSSEVKIFEFDGKSRLGLDVVATKNITKNQEIFLTYGINYWKKYSGNRKFIHKVRIITV